MRSALPVSLALTFLLFSGIARAGDAVVVLLRDGTIRGEMVELAPGDHLTLQLADGRRATVPWREIVRIGTPADPPRPAEPPPVQAPAAAAPEPPPEAEPAAPPPRADTLTLELRSPGNVQLERRGENGLWTLVCSAPCGEPIPVNGTYRIVLGKKPIEDLSFRPNQAGTHVVVHVSPKNGTVTALGVVSIVVGGLMALGAAANAENNHDGSGPLAVGLIGLALTGVGIVALAGNSPTVRREGEVATRTMPPKTSVAFTPPAGLSVPFLSFRF